MLHVDEALCFAIRYPSTGSARYLHCQRRLCGAGSNGGRRARFFERGAKMKTFIHKFSKTVSCRVEIDERDKGRA
jgi:hypothetical protein